MFWQELTDSLRRSHPGALLVTGANTLRYYAAGVQPRTARRDGFGEGYYDVFNTAVGLDSAGRMQLHHKGKLVIGVENTPTLLFDILQFLVIDLGGVVGQIGMGQHGTAFEHRGVKTGPAICYEGLYGDFFGDFVRRGRSSWPSSPTTAGGATRPATNTSSRSRACAPSNTAVPSPGRPTPACRASYRPAATSARRSAGKTGRAHRGRALNSELTFYTRYGDYLGRISEYLMLLCVLYYIAYRAKKKNHLVK